MNPTLELMAGHRSIRAFEPGELPDADVREAVSAAQMAATAAKAARSGRRLWMASTR